MAQFNKSELAQQLFVMMSQSGKKLTGEWSVGSFYLPEQANMDANMLLSLFAEELDTYYIGGYQVPILVKQTEYGPTIFFLMRMKNMGECGKHLYSFTIHD